MLTLIERETGDGRTETVLLAPELALMAERAEGPEAALDAGLRYVSDTMPGIRRKKAGRSFTYVGPDGQTVRDPKTLARIRALGIPPAWNNVWICPHANGHIQATGRDAKGRKQYRYHERWREVRDENKYGRLIAFGEALPAIRKRLEEDLALPGLARDKVLATVVRLLEATLIRVGNDEYARQNDSFGLTTLRDQHVDVEGSMLRFQFRGKSGKEHTITVRDRRLARIVKKSQDLPGQELFQYVDEQGERRTITSTDVNDYLRRITGCDFTAKDFRTWAGTVLAFCELSACEECDSETQSKKNVAQVVKSVSARLGNTPAVCRKCYVHPGVIETYLDPEARPSLHAARAGETRLRCGELPRDEAALLRFLCDRAGIDAEDPLATLAA